jgi:hypothetical protein
MTMTLPVRRSVWLLDWDRSLSEQIGQEVREAVPDAEVRAFDDPVEAATALCGSEPSAVPMMLVTDRVGVAPMGGGRKPPVAAIAREASPATAITLFSSSVSNPAEADFLAQLRRQGLADRMIAKPDRGAVVRAIGTCLTGWGAPTLTRLREHILGADDPGVHFYDDGHGGALSLFDIHRQIACRGPLAEELERVWGPLLLGVEFDDLFKDTAAVVT